MFVKAEEVQDFQISLTGLGLVESRMFCFLYVKQTHIPFHPKVCVKRVIVVDFLCQYKSGDR